jgi:hypothetical protein
MAMGIVSDSDLESELANLNRPKQQVEIKQIDRGRGHNNEAPESLRRIIGEESLNGTPASDIANAFGISKSSISAYKHGATSTASYNNPNPDLKRSNNIIRDKIVRRSNKKLLAALDQITDDKLKDAKLRDLASVSNALASVLDKVGPKDTGEIKIDKLLVYAPRIREEQSYDIIEVRE